MVYPGYKLIIEKKAQKFLEKQNYKEYEQLTSKIKDLVSNEIKPLNIKKLKGYKNIYRLKVDNYRIIFAPITNKRIIIIALIGHRKEIYDIIKKIPLNF